MLDAGVVPVTEGDPSNPGEHHTTLDLMHPAEVDPAGGQAAAVQHREDVQIAAGVFSGDHRHLEGAIAASLQQSVSNPLGRQRGAE